MVRWQRAIKSKENGWRGERSQDIQNVTIASTTFMRTSRYLAFATTARDESFGRSPMADSFVSRPFFGGAIQASLPAQFRDLASVREVPDNQECWHDVDTDALFVMELMELDNSLDVHAAARNYWKDLCDLNESTQQDLESFTFRLDSAAVRGLPASSTIGCGNGLQRVLLGRAFDFNGNLRPQEERFVRVNLCLIRLPSVQTDILLTLSQPCGRHHPENVGMSTNAQDAAFQAILASLNITDWSLFIVAE
jgi:hypothetical protein